MNPPTDTRLRVQRGSSWDYGLVPSLVRAASRRTRGPSFRSSLIGFRCALRVREPRV